MFYLRVFISFSKLNNKIVIYQKYHSNSAVTMDFNADQFIQLGGENVDGGAGGEAGYERIREVISEEGKPTKGHRQLIDNLQQILIYHWCHF